MATGCILENHIPVRNSQASLESILAERREMANRKHKVQFDAHRIVREEVPVKFKTRDGERVSFEAKKKVKEPVRVKFMAKN
jgi:hypothetical protein